LSQALFIEPRFPLVQDSTEDKAGDKKKRGHGIRIAATAGPLPHHHHSETGGIASQEDSTTSSHHDDLGKRASANIFVGTLHSMSAGEWLTGVV